MNILVTGASGFLGANVVKDLLSHGYKVNALIRKTSNTLGLAGLNPNLQIGDLQNKESIIAAAKNCDAIIHCAANTKQWDTSKKEHDQVNLEGTRNILAAAEISNVSKLIFVSTANTFPLSNHSDFLLNTDYIRSKQAAEELVLSQKKIPAIVINPSFMIGERDVKPSSGQAVLHYLNHNPVFTPAGGKSFIHVMDVAEAIRKSLLLDIHGKRFLMANDNRSYKSFFRLIGEVTGKKKTLIVIPKPLSKLAGMMGTLYGNVTGKSPKLTIENTTIINTNLYYNGDPSYQELEIKKRPLEEAIEESINWFRDNHYCT